MVDYIPTTNLKSSKLALGNAKLTYMTFRIDKINPVGDQCPIFDRLNTVTVSSCTSRKMNLTVLLLLLKPLDSFRIFGTGFKAQLTFSENKKT